LGLLLEVIAVLIVLPNKKASFDEAFFIELSAADKYQAPYKLYF
jgi:hypothetical protein